MKITDVLGSKILIFDGAMGTMLQSAGLPSGELPERWNLENPGAVLAVHRAYAEAGCDILKTNTLGANRLKLGGDVERTVSAAVSLARQAAGDRRFVALDIGPTGKLLRPYGDLDFEEAVAIFGETAGAGENAGADLVLLETMTDTLETRAAVIAVKERTSLPIFVTLTFDVRGRLLGGGDVASAAVMLQGLGVTAVGFNCGLGPEGYEALFPLLRRSCTLPLAVSPNAGMPRYENGKTHYNVEPETFAGAMRRFAEAGAWAVGGCCGTTPEHVRRTAECCRKVRPGALPSDRRTWISCRSHALEIGRTPAVIGERINPTGKPLLRQALRAGDLGYIVREGIAQQQAGAHILDVNAGLPDIDEAKVLRQMVLALQQAVDLPLQLDTADPAALEAALRSYDGKAMINSVSGKRKSMEAVFPLARKYGGAVVALTLDEDGIPDTPEGRLAVARRIVNTAAEYGIPPADLVFDPLTMAVSAGENAARVTLEALRLIREQLGCATVLGVSNVSFGLPARETAGAAFLAMALRDGLSAAIVNPLSGPMMDAFHAGRMLLGHDPRCADYIARYGAAQKDSASEKPARENKPSLRDAVIRGLKDRASEAAAERAATEAPLSLIDGEIIPALDEVGRYFESGRFFLPQLLLCAEAARAAFDTLRVHMERSGTVPEKKGKIVLATVRGDVHDIGKNIVKVLLENYGYEVIDLGRDVPAEKVTGAVCAGGVRLAGLSALMTTTLRAMEETVAALRAAAPDCRIMVGGAVLNEQYAKKIGADFYGKDAMASVRYAEKLHAEGLL